MIKLIPVKILVLVAAMMLIFPVAGLADEVEKININTATVEELVKLKQIGPAYAQRIVDYRTEHGPFEKPEDIVNVTGIGPKTFELNKDAIVTE